MNHNLTRVYIKKIRQARTTLAKLTFVKYMGVPYETRINNLNRGYTEW